MRHRISVSIATAALAGGLVAAAVVPASAAPVATVAPGVALSCNYDYYAYTTLGFLGTAIYIRQRNGSLKEKYRVNSNPYPSLQYSDAAWGYGWRSVTSTGWRGAGTISPLIYFDSYCI